MNWFALILILLGAAVVICNLHSLWKSGRRLRRDETSPHRPSRVALVGSVLAILGALISMNKLLTVAALVVVILDPDGPLWIPIWLAWHHLKRKDESSKHAG